MHTERGHGGGRGGDPTQQMWVLLGRQRREVGASGVKPERKAFLLEVDLPPAPSHQFPSHKESSSPSVPVPPCLAPPKGRKDKNNVTSQRAVFSCFLLILQKNNYTPTLHTCRQLPVLPEAPLQTTWGYFKGLSGHRRSPRGRRRLRWHGPISRDGDKQTPGNGLCLGLGNRTKRGNANLTLPTTHQLGPNHSSTSVSPFISRARCYRIIWSNVQSIGKGVE